MEDIQQHPFSTPSGKIEIDSRMFRDMEDPAMPSIPTHLKAWEGPEDSRFQTFPLQLISPHSKARANSQFDNIPRLKKLADDALWINPQDADPRGIQNGDVVQVFNDRGRLTVAARVTHNIMPGVISLDQGIWYQPDGHGIDRAGCVNVLTPDGRSPAGAFPSNSCLVEVEKG
jgi:anaerobic dimethyl sulfoxide reductase subunit A